jgi:phosphoglycerate dehydrogenase-like enzyme
VEAIRDAEVYFGFGISRPLFREARSLRWVHSAAAGVGAALFPEMVASPVVLTNSAGVHAVPIAEHVVGGVLYLLRMFDVAVSRQRSATWDKEPFVGAGSLIREMSDCRVLVVGAGGLGQAIATRMSALGARCTGLRRRPDLGVPQGFDRVAGLESLDSELPNSDVLVLTVPLTQETRGLMTASRLDRLPREAILVNVARGALVDEEALAVMLASRRIRGAVLDVFAEEPLPPGSPFWGLESVLLTPHVSAVSPGRFWDRAVALFAENWRRYERGAQLRNQVDKQSGY